MCWLAGSVPVLLCAGVLGFGVVLSSLEVFHRWVGFRCCGVCWCSIVWDIDWFWWCGVLLVGWGGVCISHWCLL